MPLFESVQLPLPIPSFVAPSVPEVSSGLLFRQHREERHRQRGCEAGIEQRLDGENLGRGSVPGGGVGVRVGEE